jgi:predicted ester cyclase
MQDAEFQGITPANKQVAFSSIELDRMLDGKVRHTLRPRWLRQPP